jgi:hypothetical protein
MGKAIVYNAGEGSEGEIFCKWLYQRLIVSNKNVLGAELGPTGSGKSYRDLRKAELWYKFYFNEDFPEKNICFGVSAAMGLISSGKLRKGEIIIFEEAGVNLGALDFQNKISKMMNYILQSFRSMNIAIFFNLPYLSMLNSSARKLLHYSFESCGIDPTTKLNKCKPFFHQVNQDTGKVYKKYPIVKFGPRTKKVKRFNFSMPAPYLVKAYEKKKAEYLKELTMDFKDEVDRLESRKKKAPTPTEEEVKAYVMHETGKKVGDISQIMGKSNPTINRYIQKVRAYIEMNKQRVKPSEIPAYFEPI